jgi:glycosyltransferase involved in cell wall biosynthesis
MSIRVSVIIPCHNAGPWICEALRSVAAQTFPPHETIVVDDNSTDNSLEEIERSGVPVTLLRSQMGNAAGTRNVGIQAATGDWLALLDADDIWYPKHLERAIELIDSTDNVAFMSSHDWISLSGVPIPIPKPFACRLTAPRTGASVDEFFQLYERNFHFGHSTVLYRRSRVLDVGMFDATQKRRHDIDLWLRVIAGRRWTYDHVKSAGYREGTPGSISKDQLECDYYYLRALTKNAAKISSPLLKKHLERQARRAMGIGFFAPPAHYIRIRQLAWPHLSPLFKFSYACGSVCPGVLRGLLTAKRAASHLLFSQRHRTKTG